MRLLLFLVVYPILVNSFHLFSTPYENALSKLQSNFVARNISTASVFVRSSHCLNFTIEPLAQCGAEVRSHLTRACSAHLESSGDRKRREQPPEEPKYVDCVSFAESYRTEIDFMFKHKILTGNLHSQFKELPNIPKDMSLHKLTVPHIYCDVFPVKVEVCDELQGVHATGTLFELEAKDSLLFEFDNVPPLAILTKDGEVYPVYECKQEEDSYRCEGVMFTDCALPSTDSCGANFHNWVLYVFFSAIAIILLLVLIFAIVCFCMICKK